MTSAFNSVYDLSLSKNEYADARTSLQLIVLLRL